jgi:hypothetical protein
MPNLLHKILEIARLSVLASVILVSVDDNLGKDSVLISKQMPYGKRVHHAWHPIKVLVFANP